MENYQLSSRQIASLKALHRTLRDRKEADRVKAVVLLGSGWSVSTVAEAIMLDANTVRSYFDKYVHGGEEELLESNYAGRQLMLTTKQEKALSRHLDVNEIHVILDNASYCKSKWLQKRLTGSKIILHYLHGYSPNLNVIERLWKFFKKRILYNKYYEKFDDFVSACKGFSLQKKSSAMNYVLYTVAGRAIGFALEQPLHVVTLTCSASGNLK
ncbi:MAG: transposase [Planctomycetaceae bacterium]|jgi:transposase|nr:transposase [Planctomycetaceae bacterium]